MQEQDLSPFCRRLAMVPHIPWKHKVSSEVRCFNMYLVINTNVLPDLSSTFMYRNTKVFSPE